MEMSESPLCTAIVQQAWEAVIFADRAGHIRIWNHGAEAIFGYGRKLYVELSFGLVRTLAGEVAGSLAIGRPGDQRFANDAGMQAQVAGLQRELAAQRPRAGS
jgi:sensor histidine kinase regulating citrate/malate metabolism